MQKYLSDLYKLEIYFNNLIETMLIKPHIVTLLKEHYPTYSFKVVPDSDHRYRLTVYLPDGKDYYLYYDNDNYQKSPLDIIILSDITKDFELCYMNNNIPSKTDITNVMEFYSKNTSLPDYLESVIKNDFSLTTKVDSFSLVHDYGDHNQEYNETIKPVLQKFIGLELLKL